MKRVSVLSLLLLSACSSATSPVNSMSGHWVASFQVDTSGAPTSIWSGGLTQMGQSITGTVICGASVAQYSVSGQIVQEPGALGLNLTFIGVGNDTAHFFGTARDSANYGVIASGNFGDNAPGQCLSGTGHWFARQFVGP
ncbi:MAG TPA: hypothetical protein VN674_03760 [Gemmatimonadales bacterium]|nr:hypothetical protein [Gemmatimonadales bacterium]